MSDMATPPPRVLLCLGPCHGEFYLPLDLDERIACPNDSAHPVAVYQSPTIHAPSDQRATPDEPGRRLSE